ncbi:Fe-Mn family superoxide dismutase [Mesorhizobium sp. USDA 4775]|uniref:superoxide dismutase n=1 Tax=Mesorhizobium jarvisii TaxID=1777867 RepID=UPI00049A0D3A|nr:superoxide dismutase [Mesorhizobium jarvisii]MCH4561422.1 superoxide dismutase [Mesorhizobium jarvisii]QGU20925.1 superoxide dismutase [Mesorhizobium huakuii 7653R]
MTALTRRNLLTLAAGATAVAATTRISLAQQYDNATSAGAGAPFVLPALPYATNALEQSIDAQTMELHHDKHHAAYVNNLNDAAKLAPQIAGHPMEHVLANLSDVPESVRTTVRNNMGGHVNHSMYWQIMGGNGANADGELLAAIDRDLGGLEKLQMDFNSAGGRVFGSGWVFVTVSAEGKLAIEARPNQDTPLMDSKRVLFGNDVWEHSYYLRYQNRRADYLKAWWNIVNWSKITERYKGAKEGTLTI